MYDAYKGIFDNVIASMRVFAQENQNLSGIRLGKKGAGDSFADATFDSQDGAFDLNVPTVRKKKTESSGSNDFLFLAIIAVVAVLVIIKLKKKKG